MLPDGVHLLGIQGVTEYLYKWKTRGIENRGIRR